jgi:hypothetical protein
VLKSVKVPDEFVGPFEKAETYVESLFASFVRTPEQAGERAGMPVQCGLFGGVVQRGVPDRGTCPRDSLHRARRRGL